MYFADIMAGPVDLDDPTNETTFPSWAAGTKTKIGVKNKGCQDAEVIIQAGAATGEVLSVAAGQTMIFERDFGGLKFRIINQNGIPVKVWSI